jgi:hypothetical protein
MTAFDCSGVKPFASSRWATLRVSKLVERVGVVVLKRLHLVKGPRVYVEAAMGRRWSWDDGGWRRRCTEARACRDMGPGLLWLGWVVDPREAGDRL